MSLPNPGREWTEKERLQLISIISDLQIQHTCGVLMIGCGNPLDPNDYAQRIHSLATKDAEFLERNRANILSCFS